MCNELLVLILQTRSVHQSVFEIVEDEFLKDASEIWHKKSHQAVFHRKHFCIFTSKSQHMGCPFHISGADHHLKSEFDIQVKGMSAVSQY